MGRGTFEFVIGGYIGLYRDALYIYIPKFKGFVGVRHISTPIMENQTEKKMENETGTVLCRGLQGLGVSLNYGYLPFWGVPVVIRTIIYWGLYYIGVPLFWETTIFETIFNYKRDPYIHRSWSLGKRNIDSTL